MGMFCNQCQETAKGYGCQIKGVCGKTEDVANLQDLLLFVMKGISYYTIRLRERGFYEKEPDIFVMKGLFSTITNANFAGNYGNAWWKQREEFESFNGPILFTTNCLVPPLPGAPLPGR